MTLGSPGQVLAWINMGKWERRMFSGKSSRMHRIKEEAKRETAGKTSSSHGGAHIRAEQVLQT